MVQASMATPERSEVRNLWAFGATSFLNDTASEMAYWILPAFLVSIGAGPEKLGLIEGIAESVSSLAKLLSGYVADRVTRRKPLVVVGYAVANSVKPLLAITTSWWQVLCIRFADRLAKGVRGTPRDVMVAESVDAERVGGAFGMLQAMDSAGAIAGPALALWMVARHSFRGVFWAAAIPGVLAVLLAICFIRDSGQPRCRPVSDAAKPASAAGKINLGAGFYYLLVATGLFSLANSSDMFLVLRAQSTGIPARQAPLLGLVFNVAYTALAWPAGRLADRVSKHVIAASGYLVFAGVYLVFALARSALLLWLTMASYGLFYALTNPVLRALIVSTVAGEARGRALGIYFFVTSVAVLIASVITGELWKHYGPATPFTFSAVLALIAALMLLLLAPRDPRPSSA